MTASWLGQFTRFGVLGIVATLTHATVFSLLFSPAGLHHLVANLVAFAVAFEVSYLGHARWSFADNQRTDDHRLRFLLLQVMATPLTVFHLSRLRAFAPDNRPGRRITAERRQ